MQHRGWFCARCPVAVAWLKRMLLSRSTHRSGEVWELVAFSNYTFRNVHVRVGGVLSVDCSHKWPGWSPPPLAAFDTERRLTRHCIAAGQCLLCVSCLCTCDCGCGCGGLGGSGGGGGALFSSSKSQCHGLARCSATTLALLHRLCHGASVFPMNHRSLARASPCGRQRIIRSKCTLRGRGREGIHREQL